MVKLATVCSGIGSPEAAIKNIKIPHEVVFACEIDKYARASYEAIHDANNMYIDMTKEEWDLPEQYADLFIGGIPCQAFSLAGKRLGELDPRGLLFFDFYRYVKNQQPKVFIIENVKGLLSMDGGKVFQNWLLLLGNSVNGHSQMFNHPDSLEYNLHHTVLNTKKFGLPQNRERVFIVGIRKDLHNDFRFPVGWKLEKRLKDVLETFETSRFKTSKEFDAYMKKYYLSEKMVETLIRHENKISKEETPNVSACIHAGYYKMGGRDQQYLKVKEAPKQGFAIAEPGDSINLSNPNSDTRRGRVSKQIANTLDTACNQAVVTDRIRRLTPLECWRLQGFSDEDFYKAQKVNSDTQLYKQAGNSISVPVMQAIINNATKLILDNN